MNPGDDLIQIVQAGIDSVRPSILFPPLFRKQQLPELQKWQSCREKYLLCIGKASLEAGKTILEIEDYPDHFLLAPYHSSYPEFPSLRVRFGSHPLPDQKSVRATEELLAWVNSLPPTGSLLVVLSGGASALLVAPVDGLSLESKIRVNELLIRSGASIHEINTVRKHLSAVKGGQLGRLVSRIKSTFVLVISDVIGDDLATIGSGPFYPDPTSFAESKALLERYQIWDQVDEDVRAILTRGMDGQIPETPKQEDVRIPHLIVASNQTARSAAASRAGQLGFSVNLAPDPVSGPVEEFADSIRQFLTAKETKKAYIRGGEVTVRVKGSGTGGRSQHLVLLLAKVLSRNDAAFAAAGTDGIDGNSPADGAWADGLTLQKAGEKGIDYSRFLREFDSYHFFELMDQLIVTGPTGTNVNDLYILITL